MGPLPRPGRKEGRGCSGQPWKRQTQLTPLSWPSTWKPWKRQKQGARRGWQMLLPRNWNSSPPLMSPGQGAPSTGARVASQGRLCSPLLLQALLSGLEKPTATLEKEGKKKKSKPAQDLEKSKPKDLEKSQGSTTHGSATKGLEKPVVVVDWHNTLEKDDVVSQDNLAGLEKLQEHCRVILLSAVDTVSRKKQVLVDMDAMIPDHIHQQGLGKETCWEKCGEGGKADLAWQWDAVAIFDDNWHICQECEAWGIDGLPGLTEEGSQGGLPHLLESCGCFPGGGQCSVVLEKTAGPLVLEKAGCTWQMGLEKPNPTWAWKSPMPNWLGKA